MKSHSRIWRIAYAVVAIFMALSLQTAFAENKNPKVLPPNSHPYGMTYGEWSAKWWQYVFSLPAGGHPLADQTGEQCSVGQLGPVFFLVGTTGGTVTRNCTIPAGKAILIPIINSAFAVPDDAATVDEIKFACSSQTDAVSVESLKVVVDGQELQDLGDYRFTSPIFSFTGASPGIFSTPDKEWYEGYRELAFADGYWIMVSPLPAGSHTIHFEAEMPIYNFRVDVTYYLTVGKEKK